jgi:hypothetical protein
MSPSLQVLGRLNWCKNGTRKKKEGEVREDEGRRPEDGEKKNRSSPMLGGQPPRIHVRWKKRLKIFAQEKDEEEMEGEFELREDEFWRFFGFRDLEFRILEGESSPGSVPDHLEEANRGHREIFDLVCDVGLPKLNTTLFDWCGRRMEDEEESSSRYVVGEEWMQSFGVSRLVSKEWSKKEEEGTPEAENTTSAEGSATFEHSAKPSTTLSG